MQKLVDFVVKQSLITVVGALLICILGAYAWQQLDVEAYPDISDIEVTIITQMQGLPAEEMELQVTVPVERALNTVPGVIARRSRTIFGLSIVRLTFNDRANLLQARQLVLEKLSGADLPPDAQPVLGPMTPSIGEIFRYVIEAPDTVSLAYLRELQDYVIIPKLLQSEGVIDVANFGGLVRQFQIIINPLQLEKYGLSIDDVTHAIQANNKNTGGNYLRIGSSQMNIRGVGRINQLEDIQKIPVDNHNGVPILLKDIGRVELGILPPTGVLGYHDASKGLASDRGIEGIVLLRKFENPSRTIDAVYQNVAILNNIVLPKGVKIIPFYDRTELVSLTIETVVHTLGEGMLVVLLVLTILLGNWRAALISSLSIPFSLLFAFVLMWIIGIPANLLSLGAIDFGIIVDASIVMVEAIIRNFGLAQAHTNGTLASSDNSFKFLDKITGRDRAQGIVSKSAAEVIVQILFAVGIIILAFLPMFTLQRVEGRLFSPMAYTLAFAIFGSMVYAVTVVPALASRFFSADTKEPENKVWHTIQAGYSRSLRFFIKFPAATLITAALIVSAGFYSARHLGTEFLPELDEGCVWVRVFLPSGISLDNAKAYPDMIRQKLAALPEVRGVLSQLGRNDDGTDPYGPNRIEILMQLKQPYKDWESHLNKAQFVQKVKLLLQRLLPGIAFTITQPIIDTTTENATGSSADLAVFITGANLDTLRTKAIQILKIVKTVQGASESTIEQENKQSQLVVTVDRQAAARYNVNVADINSLLELAIGGMPVSSLYESERKFDIVLRYTKETRNTPQLIGKLLVRTQSGTRIPLSQLANIHLEEGQTVIFRDNAQRQLIVKTNIRGRDQGSFAEELDQKIGKQVKLPSNYTYLLGGQFENLKRSQTRLSIIVPITLFLIFLVLLLFFANKWQYALVTMTNIPFAVIGGITLLHLRDMNFSISAGVGFVSLFGISVMSGVLLISYLNANHTDNLEDTVVNGSAIQFRPRFLVMLIAIIGLMPAALNTGIGSDVQRPLATVIVGGLSSSLLLTMFVTPVLYFVVHRRMLKTAAKREAKANLKTT